MMYCMFLLDISRVAEGEWLDEKIFIIVNRLSYDKWLRVTEALG